jgi:hypothetical protein
MPKRKLPKDPDNMNGNRAGWAEAAILTFEAETKVDREDALCDLIADLAHWCDRNKMTLANEIRRAMGHYEAETEGGGRQFDGVVGE